MVALMSTQCTRMLKKGSVMFVKRLGVLDVGKVATFPSTQKFLSLLSHQQLASDRSHWAQTMRLTAGFEDMVEV